MVRKGEGFCGKMERVAGEKRGRLMGGKRVRVMVKKGRALGGKRGRVKGGKGEGYGG